MPHPKAHPLPPFTYQQTPTHPLTHATSLATYLHCLFSKKQSPPHPPKRLILA
ncbi:MAG: hypothetical protein NZM04_06230 [Methylacidiphilales bacterium]|nr:hypothetical protein [Candidatus Methylacidiphilales bacterium]